MSQEAAGTRTSARLRTGSLLAVVACLVFVGVVAAPASQAQDPTTCVGVFSGAADNVVVPPGTFCRLLLATVKGNVKALENSQLVVEHSTVGGSIDADKAEVVQVLNAFVGANIQIKEGETADPGAIDAAICNNTGAAGRIGGNIQIEKMVGDVVVGISDDGGTGCVLGNTVGGNIKVEENLITEDPWGLDVRGNDVADNLQVFKNTGAATKSVMLNTVAGVIQCYGNSSPFVGGPNFGKADPWMGFPFFGPNQCMGTST